MIEIQESPRETQVVLRPNRSLTWLQSKWILVFIGGFCLSIAVVWSLLGAWFILPFAGLEVGLLVIVMYLTSRATYQKQLLIFQSQQIYFRQGRGQRVKQCALARDSSVATWIETNHPEDVRQLYLVDGQRRIRIGEFLNLEDQNQLLELFEKLGIRYQEDKKPVSMRF